MVGSHMKESKAKTYESLTYLYEKHFGFAIETPAGNGFEIAEDVLNLNGFTVTPIDSS